MVKEGIHKPTRSDDVKILVDYDMAIIFYQIVIILIIPIPILSEGFKEHGWPDDAVVIQKSMYSKRPSLFLIITFFTKIILQGKAFLSRKPYEN